jgi:hypothetical protein
MKTLRIRNTEENAKQLENGNHAYTVVGKFLEVIISDYHAMWINNGQMSVASYKKNVLCV